MIRHMKPRWMAMILALTVLLEAAMAQQTLVPMPRRDYAALASGSLMQDKDFYLFTLLMGLPAIRAALAGDPALAALAAHRRAALAVARSSCNGDGACLNKALLWPDEEIEQAAEILVERLDRAGLLHELAEAHMRRSGRFARHQGLDDKALVHQAWIDAARAMNHILHVYGLGEPPLYPLIDSISYAPGDPMWKDAIDDMVDVALDEPHSGELFFDLSLSAALDVLYMNDRDEPTRMEPLDKGENEAAIAYARTVDWSKYRYPVILIPGRSPVLKDNPLSPEAKMKMRLAARRFNDGLVPLIVVSGGFCNPSQTRFNEALEMKRELMRTYHIPQSAILIDPFARHTTTNLRNTERLLFEIGAPLDRPVLVTTTAYQSRYMEGLVFHDRCQRELGYLCFSDFKRLSLFDTEMKLPLVSLHRDANDPLDP
jgi:hypothetical protein